jgi:hypothetical protein
LWYTSALLSGAVCLLAHNVKVFCVTDSSENLFLRYE